MTPDHSTIAGTSIRRRLGKGLGSLISSPVKVDVPAEISQKSVASGSDGVPDTATTPTRSNTESSAADHPSGLRMIEITRIQPNPKQPRQHFDESALAMLAGSIASSGLMQPIVVRPAPRSNEPSGTALPGAAFQIIAGERRWRAAQLAGLKHIPAVVRDVDDRTAAELSLVENLQREDLNPIERADAFKRLVEDFGLSQQEIASQVGLDRSSISNHLRLLELDEPTRQSVRDGRLTMGHAKALLSITNLSRRNAMAQQAVRGDWSVRELERRAKPAAGEPTAAAAPTEASPRLVSRASANAADLARRLSEHLGTKVHVQPGRTKGSGRLIIEFFTLDQFEGLLSRLQYEGD